MRPATIHQGPPRGTLHDGFRPSYWGVDLRSAVVEIVPGVAHRLDLVSADRSVLGDAMWFKNINAGGNVVRDRRVRAAPSARCERPDKVLCVRPGPTGAGEMVQTLQAASRQS